MKTQEQILERIKELLPDDFLGFSTQDLIFALSFDNAKPYLKEGADQAAWDDGRLKTDDEVKAKMLDYMPFAWEKANNCRGISAARSMSHYASWVWLIGDEDKLGNLEDYEFYGKDSLVAICELYGWDHSQWDDGRRVNSDTED